MKLIHFMLLNSEQREKACGWGAGTVRFHFGRNFTTQDYG